jgi:hypothetical protein
MTESVLQSNYQNFAPSLLFLSNIDSDLLTLRIVVEEVEKGFPPVVTVRIEDDLSDLDLPDRGIVIIRLLGGKLSWPDWLHGLRQRCKEADTHLLVFNGEAVMDTSLAAMSTVDWSWS